MRDLTTKQQRVIIEVSKYVAERGYPPSIRELGEILDVRSSSTVKGYLDKLKSGEYVTWQEGRPRTLKVWDKGREFITSN